MRAFVVSAILASVSHARRVQAPFDQAASSIGKDSSRDSARVLEMLALATNPHRNTLPARARSASTVMGGWGGAKNEHGHTRELNLDIPGEIADGAFLMDDDDMYGEESYEEHKPYTGLHPSELKTASSSSSGGYELEDFGSSGGSSGGYELEDFGSSGSGGAGDFGGAKNEHGHTRVLNLDIPASISTGAFTDYDDDLYGEESYEEHKPYTGAHPSEQKTASSGSSGGYQLEDFGSSGSGRDFSNSGGAGDWGGAKNEHGHTRVLNLDIPASISDGAFTDYGDDLYGEESYEEHKPYTGL